MPSSRWSVVTWSLVAGLVAACSRAPALTVTVSPTLIDGRVDTAVLQARASWSDGRLAEGVVSFVVPAGSLEAGPDVVLVDGVATARFRCDPTAEAACAGELRVGASWAGASDSTKLVVTPSSRPGPVSLRVVSTGTLSTLHAAASAPDRSVWAVGSAGAMLHALDGQWTSVATGTTATSRAVAASASGAVMAVGEAGTVVSAEGGAVTTWRLPGEEDLTALVWDHGVPLVGTAAGRVLRLEGGAAVPVVSLGVQVDVLAAAGDVVWACGEGVMAVRRSGVWTVQAAPILARLVTTSSAGDGLYLGGTRLDTGQGVVLMLPSGDDSGAGWRVTSVPAAVTAVVVPPMGLEHFAVTATGLYRQLGDGAWEEIAVPAGGLAAASRWEGDLVVVGTPGVSLFRAP